MTYPHRISHMCVTQVFPQSFQMFSAVFETAKLLFLNLLAFVSVKAKWLSFRSLYSSHIMQAAVEFGLFQDSQVAHSLCERQDRLLNGTLAQAEAPNWIASGVILTCSLTVKSRMFWFILSPPSICLGLFSAMEGFSTEGLVKVGSVYTVHAGRKWCQGRSSVTWRHESKHPHEHKHIQCHLIIHATK